MYAMYGNKINIVGILDEQALAACLKEQFEYEADMTVDTHQVRRASSYI
jgi:hypothetical protein